VVGDTNRTLLAVLYANRDTLYCKLFRRWLNESCYIPACFESLMRASPIRPKPSPPRWMPIAPCPGAARVAGAQVSLLQCELGMVDDRVQMVYLECVGRLRLCCIVNG
jgi:hypothetical protein